MQHLLERRVVREKREAGPLDVESEEKRYPYHREALPLRSAIVPLRRVDGTPPEAHGLCGFVGLFL